jgi:hypothetical protein
MCQKSTDKYANTLGLSCCVFTKHLMQVQISQRCFLKYKYNKRIVVRANKLDVCIRSNDDDTTFLTNWHKYKVIHNAQQRYLKQQLSSTGALEALRNACYYSC